MSTTTANLLWMIIPTLVLVALVVALTWFDNRIDERDAAKLRAAQRGALKSLAGEREVPGVKTQYGSVSEIDRELDRLKGLARRVAEVDAENQRYGALDISTRNQIIRQRQLTVLESLGDDMERYLQEANS